MTMNDTREKNRTILYLTALYSSSEPNQIETHFSLGKAESVLNLSGFKSKVQLTVTQCSFYLKTPVYFLSYLIH